MEGERFVSERVWVLINFVFLISRRYFYDQLWVSFNSNVANRKSIDKRHT